MAIRDWRRGQVAVVCVALLLCSALTWGGYRAWENRHAAEVAAQAEGAAASLRAWELTTRIQGRTPGGDSIIYWVQRANLEQIEANARHNRIRAVVRPAVLLFCLVVVPGITLVVLWRWYSRI